MLAISTVGRVVNCKMSPEPPPKAVPFSNPLL